ncbi:MAG: TenA family protein, partial [Duncaniella sp.]|nr:TenA family protein [Duncaniella sp.]
SRLADGDMRGQLLGFATDGISVEKAIHQSFLNGHEHEDAVPTATCLLYTSYLKSQSYSPVEVEMAAVLPCFLVYQRVGEAIVKEAEMETNPYSRWIETYSDRQFAESTIQAVAICDRLAEETTHANRRQMTEAFVMGTRMEYLFWESAYNMEKWKI